VRQEARDALRQAALKGIPQIIGRTHEGLGRCALGVIEDAGISRMDLDSPVTSCHLCGATKTWSIDKNDPENWFPIEAENSLIVHLNNDHGLDFLAIAEKMPSEEITA
jgi:hypothetical protein